MFDFVISGTKKRSPARRIFASWMTSCLAHFIVLILLIEYPELLRGGIYHNFRSIWDPQTNDQTNDDSQSWRTVAVLPSKMTMPSAETLKKLLSNSKEKVPGTTQVRIRLGDLKAVLSNQPTTPRVRNSSQPPPANVAASAGSLPPTSQTGNSGSLAGNQNDGNPGKQSAIRLPPPGPEPKSEVAANPFAPSKVPNSIITPTDTPTDSVKNVKTPEDAKIIRSPADGIFDRGDTKGFPMGEYTSRIVEMLQQWWEIPSNLKDKQGHTTVVFSIDKNGRIWGAQIIASSGSNSLDLAALYAVQSRNLPALPKDFPGDHVGARFVFSYNEHQKN
jgi:TonB family protein